MESLSGLPRSYEKVRQQLVSLPESPGVYLFRDVRGTIIYIGKSVCLRKRVRSYFYRREDDSRKIRRLRQEIRSVEWIRTGSELEALLLESRLVKQNLPRFNTLLRNYRNYPFIKVNLQEEFPRLEVTRTLERDDAVYFGPFANARNINQVVETLSDALRLRTCEAAGRALGRQRPCLRLDFGRCAGPCTNAVERPPYLEAIREACGVFEGRSERLLRVLRDRMEQSAERLQFETAARLRDAFRDIQRLVGKQQALTSAVGSLNLVTACPSRRSGTLEVFLFRAGRLVAQREVTAAAIAAPASLAAHVSELGRLFEAASGIAGRRVEQEVVDQINIITDWLKHRRGEGCYQKLGDEVDERWQQELTRWIQEAAAQILPHSGAPTAEDGRQLLLTAE
jgi:excinuclease UvrABC nuclease subunit